MYKNIDIFDDLIYYFFDELEAIKMKDLTKVDKRVLNTKETITRVFSELLKEKSIDEISVTEICQKAKINRGTFYSHYKDPYDLRLKIQDTFLNKFKSNFAPLLFTRSTENLTNFDLIYSIILFLKTNKETVDIIVDRNGRDQLFLNEIIKSGYQFVTFVYPKVFSSYSNEDISYFYSFVSGGSVQILLEWIQNNMETPMEVLSKKLNKLISSALNYFSN